MRTEPDTARFAGVSGTGSASVQRSALSGLFLPMMTARQSGPRARPRRRAARCRAVPTAAPGRARPPVPARASDAGTQAAPRHPRQVPGQRGRRVPDARVRHQGHQHDGTDHERLASSRSRSPFTYSFLSTARPAMPPITPGSALSSSESSSGPSVA